MTSALFTIAVLVLNACSSGSGDGSPPIVDGSASATVVRAIGAEADEPKPVAVPEPPRPAPSPARDADQDFLRHMLDHHETVLAIVHAQMMEPAKHAEHGTKADPTEWDGRLDLEKREMLALLKQLYDEDYSPRATAPVQAPVPAPVPAPAGRDSSHGMPGMQMPAGAPAGNMPEEHTAEESPVAGQLRDGAALAQRFALKLTRPVVRSLALRIRASQLELARQVSGEPGKPGKP